MSKINPHSAKRTKPGQHHRNNPTRTAKLQKAYDKMYSLWASMGVTFR